MRLKGKIFLIIVALGAVFALAGYNDTMMLMKGTTVDLNQAQATDLEQKALITGKVNYVIGPFAIREQTETRYGFIKHTDITEYYVAANFDAATYSDLYERQLNGDEDAEIDIFYTIISVPDGSTGMSMLSKRWEKFYEDYDRLMETGSATETGLPSIPLPPSMEVEINGFLADQPGDEEYEKYRDEMLDALGVMPYEVNSMCIVNRELDKKLSYGLFFGGIAASLLGIVFVIVSLVSAAKNKRSQTNFY